MFQKNKERRSEGNVISVLDKLDSNLRRLYLDSNSKGIDEAVQCVVVAKQKDKLSTIESDVRKVGGWVRHNLHLINAVAAMVPIRKMSDLAAKDYVERLEMVREHRILH